ncbi:amidase [Burkholderia sp. LMG 21824]|uniref:amidase n=1 Tax=Burkholderia sp. LMG 21824 TaxID=3158172 RepID=UPI003C2E81C9
MHEELHKLSVSEIRAALRAGSVTSMALTKYALDRISRYDRQLCAFITVTEERALQDARRADDEIAQGIDRGPLHGVPYALKDIYATAGVVTSCNSKLLVDHVPSEDAAVETKLRLGGGVLVGKLNTHEFAIGGPGFDLPMPPARNPWNTDHFTGGSSSGSGVALAAGFVRVALGSDTGGSIRSPACHCGVVGLKPTYGRVSRRGVYPLSYSLDHCGPMGWSVDDVASAMQVIAGFDPLDPGSVDIPVPNFTTGLDVGVSGMRIAYARRFFSDAPDVSREVVTAMDGAAQRFAELGAKVEEIELDDFNLFKACARVIMTAEAYAIHEQNLRERPLDFGRYTYQRVAPAANLSASDLIQAYRMRRELTVSFNKQVFGPFDILITTCGMGPAPRLDEFPRNWPPPAMSVAVQTAPFNVTGNPALSMPIGFTREGLPLGMQVVGRNFAEATVFQAAASFERAAKDHGKRPVFL